MFVKITEQEGKLAVTAPYYPHFIPAARHIGGRWEEVTRAWLFDLRDRARVEKLCDDVFGEHGALVERSTLRINLDEHTVSGKEYFFAGRKLFVRYERDEYVRLGEGVIIEAGGFPSSGGSKKYPQLGEPLPGTIVLVRDVPLSLAKRCDDVDGVYLWKEAT